MAGAKKLWFRDVTVYTLAGVVSTMFVGAALGWIGRLILPQSFSGGEIIIAIVVAFIALARELGWISFPLPQFRRQTRDIWAKLFPPTVAAALWGFDLGLIFTTYFTFSGIWLFVVIAIAFKQPSFGAALFLMYWVGRALSVWVAPLMMANATATPQLLDGIIEQQWLIRWIHVLGLAWSIVVLGIWLIYRITT